MLVFVSGVYPDLEIIVTIYQNLIPNVGQILI